MRHTRDKVGDGGNRNSWAVGIKTQSAARGVAIQTRNANADSGGNLPRHSCIALIIEHHTAKVEYRVGRGIEVKLHAVGQVLYCKIFINFRDVHITPRVHV